MKRTLRITGTGKLSVTPDTALIDFPIESLNYSYEQAVKNVNKSVNKLKEIISELGLDTNQLKTNNFRVNRETRYNKKLDIFEFVGFIAKHDISFEVAFDNKLIHEILKKIVASDIDVDFRISFTVSDKKSAVDSLIALAIEDATDKAKLIAKASGIALKEILNIDYAFSEVRFRSDFDMMYDSDGMLSDESSTPDITPSDINLNENVTISWRIE
jgi:uncharacterized protein